MRRTLSLILLGAFLNPATLRAQDNYWSTIDVEIILYDEETIERINGPRAIDIAPQPEPMLAQPISPQPVEIENTPTISEPSPQQATTPARPLYPRDLSPLYTEIERGIPIIINTEPCAPNGLDLRITVKNIKNSKGFIVADLHNDVVEDFLQWDKVVLRIRQSAKQGQVSFCMPLPEPGEYAVAFYHDENDNRKFDKGFLRIPKERFGMSNNPSFGLKSPEYEESSFNVPETGADIFINLVSSSDILKGSKQ